MKEYKHLILLLFVSMLTINSWGQSDNWYSDKPNTKADTLAIIKNKVKSLSQTIGSFEGDFYPTNYKVLFYVTDNKIDSIKQSDHSFFFRSVEKQTDREISEIVKMKPGLTDSSYTTCRRTHYLDKNGQVIKTENKILEGLKLEGESYRKIIYVYKNGLLMEALIFNDRKQEKDPNLVMKYSYEYY